jgi:xylitol oxidase
MRRRQHRKYLEQSLPHKTLHPIETESAENCTEQMGVAGPWYERLPHFKMGFKPSAGKELQSEYFVPIEHAYSAMMAIEKLQEKITPHLFISEIRSIAADDFWMSPCYEKKLCCTTYYLETGNRGRHEFAPAY